MLTIVQKYGCLFVLLTSACSSADTTFAPTTDPKNLLKVVRLAEHSYNLNTVQPYDTVRLHATAKLGDSSAAPVSIRFIVRDTNVTIDSTGLVHAISRTTVPIWVIASATYNGVTRADSGLVSVTDASPRAVARISITPLPGDSAVIGYAYPDFNSFTGKFLHVTAFDATGDSIPGVLVSHFSGDSTIVQFGDNHDPFFTVVYPRRAGEAWVYASTFAHGKYFRDSLRYTIKTPLYYFSSVKPVNKLVNGAVTRIWQIKPARLTVPRGSDLLWLIYPETDTSATTPTVAFTFDDPSVAETSRLPSGGISCLIRTGFPCTDVGGAGNFSLHADYVAGVLGQDARLFNRPGEYKLSNDRGGSQIIIIQ